MAMFFSRPTQIPELPQPLQSEALEDDARSLSPEFLSSLVNKGRVARFSSRGRLHVFAFEPEDVNEILVTRDSQFLKGDQEQTLSATLGWGLVGFDGETQRTAQRLAGPAFRAAALEGYCVKISKVIQESLKEMSMKNRLPLLDSMRSLTQEVAEQSLFPHSNYRSDFSYQRTLLSLHDLVMGVNETEGSVEDSLSMARYLKNNLEQASAYVKKLVAEIRESEDTEPTLMDFVSGVGHRAQDRLDSVHQQVAIFLQASIETTASLISWTMLLLKQHPEFFARLKDEVSAVSGQPVSFALTKELAWHSAVLNESLRLFPPAWMFPRIANEDMRIAGEEIARGTRVVLSPYVSHRLEGNFRNSEAFDPTRWIEMDFTLERGSFFPFGMGTRICIGERFAKLTATLFLYELIKSGYTIELDSNELSFKSHSFLLNIDTRIKFWMSK